MTRAGQVAGKAWESVCTDMARMYGWTVASFRSVLIKGKHGSYYATPVQADGEGFPDLVLVRGDRIMFRELKAGKARLTKEQKMWGELLMRAGCDYEIWREGNEEEVLLQLKR